MNYRQKYQNTVAKDLKKEELRKKYPEAYLVMDNSKFKKGEIVINILTGFVGPVQIIKWSGNMNTVSYYHGNNPISEETLKKFELKSRRRLKLD